MATTFSKNSTTPKFHRAKSYCNKQKVEILGLLDAFCFDLHFSENFENCRMALNKTASRLMGLSSEIHGSSLRS